MTKDDIATVVIKLGGLWLVITELISLVAYIPFLHGEMIEGSILPALEIFASRHLFSIGIGALLLMFGGMISYLIFPKTPPISDWNSFEARIISGVGILVIAMALGKIVFFSTYYYDLLRSDSELLMNTQETAQLAHTIFGVLFGAWLIVGRKGLIRVFGVLRGREFL